MGFDQYHEPPAELSQETRTFARMIVSMIEEAEAINWYEQRISVEKNKVAKAIMQNAQREEMKHFGMDLEFLLRQKPKWPEILKGILLQAGNILKHAEEVEEDAKQRPFTSCIPETGARNYPAFSYRRRRAVASTSHRRCCP